MVEKTDNLNVIPRSSIVHGIICIRTVVEDTLTTEISSVRKFKLVTIRHT